MNLHLTILIAYSVALMALGLWIGRRVRSAGDFFVAGRALGPGLIFSTMLAANIGAGSTVGATALGYTNGISAVWWVGSAAIGSLLLAFWIGPAMRRQAIHQASLPGSLLGWARFSLNTPHMTRERQVSRGAPVPGRSRKPARLSQRCS